MQEELGLSRAQEEALAEIHNVITSEMAWLQRERRRLTRQIQARAPTWAAGMGGPCVAAQAAWQTIRHQQTGS